MPAISLTIGAVVGRSRLQPARAGEHDRAVVARARCASWSESWLPVTNTNGVPVWATWLVRLDSSGLPRSVRSPAKNTGPSPAARSRIGSVMTLLWRSDASVIRGRSSTGGRPAGRGDEPREADELRVELLVERVAGAPDGLDRVERARDVGAVGVVLRRVDRAARRQQDDERDAERDRGRDRGADRVAAASGRAAPDRERDEDPERAAAQGHHEDQRAQVGRDRVARLPADRLTSSWPPSATRWSASRSTVLRSTRSRAGQPDRLEARAPVDERDVDVERARVAGGDRQPDRADRQLAVLPERDEREVAADQRGDDDREHGPDARAVAQDVPPSAGRRLGSLSVLAIDP